MKRILALLIILLLAGKMYPQSDYSNNEDGEYEDMLTPEYYLSGSESEFRDEVNKLVHFARQIPFSHPLEDLFGNIPSYIIPACPSSH